MIEPKKISDTKTVFFDPGGNVLASESSGETSCFNAKGNKFVLQNNERFYAGAEITPLRGLELIALPASFHQPQWHHTEDLLADFNRFDNVVKYGSESSFLLAPPVASDYGRQQETSSGKRFQSVIWVRERSGSKARWVNLFDDQGLAHAWMFDKRVHLGSAKEDFWHEMFYADSCLVFNLSSNDIDASLPHYRCGFDGSEWAPIKFDGTGTSHRSHITVDSDLIASGWWRGPTAVISINNIFSGRQLAELRNVEYSHGCLRGDNLVYSVYDRGQERDVEVRLWNWQTNKDELIDVVEGGGRSFYQRARPMLNNQGDKILYHQMNGGRVEVVLCDKSKEVRPGKNEGALALISAYLEQQARLGNELLEKLKGE